MKVFISINNLECGGAQSNFVTELPKGFKRDGYRSSCVR